MYKADDIMGLPWAVGVILLGALAIALLYMAWEWWNNG